jgi:nucleoside-triphosphatase THEP1
MPTQKQRKSTGCTKVLLIDEVDLLSFHDKGFYSAIAHLLQNSKEPIVLTANGTLSSLE